MAWNKNWNFRCFIYGNKIFRDNDFVYNQFYSVSDTAYSLKDYHRFFVGSVTAFQGDEMFFFSCGDNFYMFYGRMIFL